MKTIFKKSLAIVLTAVMLLTLVPFSVSAKMADDSNDNDNSNNSGSVTSNQNFMWGEDNWNFNNEIGTFGSKYIVNDSVLEKLKQNYNLDTIREDYLKSRIFEKNNNKDNSGGWTGACSGMTTTEILAKKGLLDLSYYVSSNENNSNNEYLNQYSNNNDIISLINAFQLMQGSQKFKQIIGEKEFKSKDYSKDSQKELIKKIEEYIENKELVYIGYRTMMYYYKTNKYEKNGDHAVLAYDIKECNYELDPFDPYGKNSTGKKNVYDRKILICDPNHSQNNEKDQTLNDCCIYYNSENYSWICPDYKVEKPGVKKKMCFWNAPDPKKASDEENFNTGQLLKIRVFDTKNIEEFSGGCSTTNKNNYYNKFIEYNNIAYDLKAPKMEEPSYNPNGYIKMKCEKNSVNTDYSIKMITNDEDWYALTVRGECPDTVILKKGQDGYFLSGSNLNNIILKANNSEKTTYSQFSTIDTEVFIYETNDKTIGVRADKDGDGNYETELPIKTLKFGDTNGDYLISIDDVTYLQRYLSELVNFTNTQLELADMNGDGYVNVKDVTEIQRMIAELI